jgi:HEAT repeat protein
MNKEEVIDQATALLRERNSDSGTRARAAQAVGYLKASRAAQDVVNATLDEVPIVREWAAWAFGQIYSSVSVRAFWAKQRVVYARHLKEEEIGVLERISLGETQPSPLPEPDRVIPIPAPLPPR